jgi:YrbI family 3-deoxy-D-manno-octulosonate 8-phosphate phosphatase
MNAMKTLHERCAVIELLVADVDGVLTDGGIVYGSDGIELKQFHVRDGSGLKCWEQAGKRAAFLTGRRSAVVERRGLELGIPFILQGVLEKLPALRRLLDETGLKQEQVCYIGDDLPDLPPLRHCGLAVAVADACPEARAEAHYITQAPGGHGAVREAIELILRSQGRWQLVVERLRGERL